MRTYVTLTLEARFPAVPTDTHTHKHALTCDIKHNSLDITLRLFALKSLAAFCVFTLEFHQFRVFYMLYNVFFFLSSFIVWNFITGVLLNFPRRDLRNICGVKEMYAVLLQQLRKCLVY